MRLVSPRSPQSSPVIDPAVLFTAARIPMLIQNTSAMIIASRESSSVTGSLLAISCVTGLRRAQGDAQIAPAARALANEILHGDRRIRLSSARSWAMTAGSRLPGHGDQRKSPGSSFAGTPSMLTSNSVGTGQQETFANQFQHGRSSGRFLASVKPARRTMPSGPA